jgi:hypothetical protein
MDDVKALTQNVDAAREASIQDRATNGNLYSSASILSWLVRGGEIVAPWWSRRRDLDLRNFWQGGDHLSGAVYTLRTKVTTLPFQVIPRDMSVKAHVRAADRFEQILHDSEFGEGWPVAIGRFVEDVLTTDNGGFMEVIGDGDADGPIVGPALGVAHLDSARCQRTSNPEYPVLYEDTGGRLYKLHYTRVISLSQMTSPRVEMRGVGFCAVSRCINTGQNLIDIATYKQEKLGSRPARQMLVGSNISADEIMTAFQIAEMQMDNAGLGRYAKIVAIGNKTKDVRIDVKDLASVPDGFDEEKSVTLGMFTIALAFGVDARELWPASSSGATKADAMIQHLKARGKAFGSLINGIEAAINRKVLPGYLRLRFDQQDDEQDANRAEINEKRSQQRQRDAQTGALTVRVMRERMLEDGEISDAQFSEMELEDGRLPDGTQILALFASPDSRMQALLAGVDPSNPDPVAVEAAIRRNEPQLFTSPNAAMREQAVQANAALRWLLRPKPPTPGQMADSDQVDPTAREDGQEQGGRARVGGRFAPTGDGGETEVQGEQTAVKALAYTPAESVAMLQAAARVLSRGGLADD